jgi:hypothetical protein
VRNRVALVTSHGTQEGGARASFKAPLVTRKKIPTIHYTGGGAKNQNQSATLKNQSPTWRGGGAGFDVRAGGGGDTPPSRRGGGGGV